MTDKEKLTQLIYDNPEEYLSEGTCREIADHLLANGVRLETEQATSDENKRWIPVSERLPERGQEVIVASYRTIKPVVFTTIFWNKEHYNWYGITHWLPLPEPPNEVDNG